jgi:hypothetical protein
MSNTPRYQLARNNCSNIVAECLKVACGKEPSFHPTARDYGKLGKALGRGIWTPNEALRYARELAATSKVKVLSPMRWGVAATIYGAYQSLEHGGAYWNLSGGYHHAMQQNMEGFCIYNDIGICHQQLVKKGRVSANDKILISAAG